MVKWSNEEIAFAIVKKNEGRTYKEISKLIERRFGHKRTWQAIETKLRNTRNSKPVSKKPVGRPKKAKGAKPATYWTATRDEKLLELLKKTRDVKVITTSLNSIGKTNFTQKQVSDRIKKISPKIKSTKKTTKKTTTKKRTQWTKEDDFDLLCDFYELSIDEARFRFKKTYGEIASRLEYLFDSQQPEHTALLIEASKVVKERKAKTASEPKIGFWMRLKIARNKRKVKKLQKQIDKIKGIDVNGI